MTDQNTGDAQAIIDVVRSLSNPQLMRIDGYDGTDVQVLCAPNGMTPKSVVAFLNEARCTPDRRKGTAKVQDVTSLVELTNRFKGTSSALFADRSKTAPRLIAVINYHENGEEYVPEPGVDSDVARFCDHRVVYDFPLSDEWKTWAAVIGIPFSQADFAAFLEDHIGDVMPPPTSDDLTDERFPGIANFAAAIGGNWAGPAALVTLSRGLSVNVSSAVKEARNLSTGEAQIRFETEHRDDAGEVLRVPQLFMIAIPIFSDDDAPNYRIAIRLRYRVSGGKVSWFLDPWRMDFAFRHAFRNACEFAAKETCLPLIYGTPESI